MVRQSLGSMCKVWRLRSCAQTIARVAGLRRVPEVSEARAERPTPGGRVVRSRHAYCVRGRLLPPSHDASIGGPGAGGEGGAGASSTLFFSRRWSAKFVQQPASQLHVFVGWCAHALVWFGLSWPRASLHPSVLLSGLVQLALSSARVCFYPTSMWPVCFHQLDCQYNEWARPSSGFFGVKALVYLALLGCLRDVCVAVALVTVLGRRCLLLSTCSRCRRSVPSGL